MDRFSKTTEIDTAEIAAAAMEDDTPQKSKVTLVIALISCILIAIVIWMGVMEADNDIFQRDFDDVSVYAPYTDVEPTGSITITVKGVRRVVVDFKSSDFKVVKTAENEYAVFLIESKAEAYEIKNESTDDSVIVSISKK
ncbi:MAG: hypothetical protein E7622_01335 [Ruminococcaceae bacterium]|nr:hypothetical protein [Oscillospiraceae bacterium]